MASPIPRYVLGDSVMLGAAAELSAAGFCVDVVQSRAFVNGLHQVLTLNAGARLGPIVVVALGTNGPIGDSDLGADDVRPDGGADGRRRDDVRQPWLRAGQQRQAARPTRHVPERPDRRLGQRGAGVPGRCLYDDGIHLRPDGRTYYAQQITALTG